MPLGDRDRGPQSRSSSFGARCLDHFCREYRVPEQYSAVLPAGDQRACSSPPAGTVCVYADAVMAGMRFPLHGFFCEVLTHFGVAPGQIMPNGWRVMVAFVVLSHSAGVAPSLTVFRHFFKLYASKFKGWYYFRCFHGKLFNGIPPSKTGWEEAFFFLKSRTPWPCPVNWGEPSEQSILEPVLTNEEQIVAKKLLRVRGKAVDIWNYSDTNLAAAMIIPSSAKLPPPPPITMMTPPTPTPSSSSGKGMDLSEVTENATMSGPSHPQPSTPLGQAHGSLSGVAPSSPGSSKTYLADNAAAMIHVPSVTPLQIRTTSGASTKGMDMDPQVYNMMKNLRVAKAAQAQASVAMVKKRKAAELDQSSPESSTPLDSAHASSGAAPSPPGFSIQSFKITRERDQDPMPLNIAHKPDDVSTSDWETARQMVSLSLSTTPQLEEKHVAMEREVDALRQELLQAKAELADAKKVVAEEVTRAAEAAVREFEGSTQLMLRFAKHALAGHERVWRI